MTSIKRLLNYEVDEAVNEGFYDTSQEESHSRDFAYKYLEPYPSSVKNKGS